MNRRDFLTGGTGVASILVAGCLSRGQEGRVVQDNPSYPAGDHESQIEELITEIERRDITVLGTERREEAVVVDYDSKNLNDDLAEVAMAFVERIDGGWGIGKLEALARGEIDRSWHAEAEWAQDYLDGEIDASEYGQRISETLEQTLVLEDKDSED